MVRLSAEKTTACPRRILVIGSSCVDIIIRVPRLPRTADDIHPLGQSAAMGGCAFNVASMIRLLGAPVTLLSPVGTGIYGEYAARALEASGFPVLVRVPDRENGCCYCLVEPGGERTFLSCHGAEYLFHKSWAQFLPERDYAMVYVCGLEMEEPTGEELLEFLEERRDIPLFYAPGPRGILVSRERTGRLFALHPILHVNEREALALSGVSETELCGDCLPKQEAETDGQPKTGSLTEACRSVPQAARALFARTGNTVIVTLGDRGVYCLEKSGASYFLPAAPLPAPVADTIGAGDAHAGAVLAGLSLGLSLREALEQAGRAAAAVVATEGASLTEEEFARLMPQA